MSDEQPETVEELLASYLTALQDGVELPSLDGLAEGARAEVEELLDLLGAAGLGPPDLDEGNNEGNDEGNDGRVGLRPLAESSFALQHGLTGSAPDVVVVGPAVRRAREATGLTQADVAEEMTRRSYTTEPADLDELEALSAQRMRPDRARLLAAVLELPLAAIEARAEPWPSDSASLATLDEAGAAAVVLGEEVVVQTDAGSYLGLVRCAGDADGLGSRTYRSVAATLLNGAWSHLAGVLLVTQSPPHLALPVDALDCVTRSHAPTGLSGFSRLAEPVPVAEALSAYDRAFSVSWSDPDPLERESAAPAVPGGLAGRLGEVAQQVGKEARRARQPGKRPGYETAADWLHAREPHEVAALLEDLAATPPAVALEQLSGALSP